MASHDILCQRSTTRRPTRAAVQPWQTFGQIFYLLHHHHGFSEVLIQLHDFPRLYLLSKIHLLVGVFFHKLLIKHFGSNGIHQCAQFVLGHKAVFKHQGATHAASCTG